MKNVVVTGCDQNTEWQLMWFLTNLKIHNPNIEVYIADFGMSPQLAANLVKEYLVFPIKEGKGWFKKPNAMIEAGKKVHQLHDGGNVLWMDTDCEVLGSLDPVFDSIVVDKLAMATDRPLNKRHPQSGTWYNSGVVGYRAVGIPYILRWWAQECTITQQRGDQETLHHMMQGDEIGKLRYIEPIPNIYNTLRIDLIDGVAHPSPVVMHWTGLKGNEVIERKIASA